MLSEKKNYFGKQELSLTLCPLKWVRHALDRVEEVKGFDGRGQMRVKLYYLSKRFVSVVFYETIEQLTLEFKPLNAISLFFLGYHTFRRYPLALHDV